MRRMLPAEGAVFLGLKTVLEFFLVLGCVVRYTLAHRALQHNTIIL